MNAHLPALLLFSLVLLAPACDGDRKSGGAVYYDDETGYPMLVESWLVESAATDNLDAPVLWQGPNGERWVIAACRASDRLVVHDAETGAFIRAVGVSGSGPGQFNRPNGIAVIDDLAIVVERDNHRLQVFRLPAWTVLGSFGDSALVKPYGIAARRDSSGYVLYVTDNYETPEGDIPPDTELGARVKMFRMSVSDRTVTGELLGAFGDTEGDGVLRLVEAICIDTAFGRLLIADEAGESNDIKVFNLDGSFTGTVFGAGVFRYQAEAIALYTASDSSGYYVCADQDVADNTFHLFDRATFEHVGAVRGASTTNSDGVTVTSVPSPNFPEGQLIAIRDSRGLGAINWRAVADTLRLTHRRVIVDTDSTSFR